MDARFLAYVSVMALLIVIPGPDMALVARNALRSGARSASATAFGIGAGSVGWGMAAALGVAALLARAATVFTILKLAGAAYLIYLGWHSLREGLGPARQAQEGVIVAAPAMRLRIAFRQGLLGNLLNPKAAVIFVTVIPQFIRPGDTPPRMALMLLAYEVILIGWLNLYGYLLGRAGQSRLGARVRRATQTASGLVLMGFGLRLAVEQGTR